MRLGLVFAVMTALFIVETAALGQDVVPSWPSFRGARAQGVSDGHPTPMEWDLESGRNVKWSTNVPGLAHSSPVVWGDRIYVTTAIRVQGDSEIKVGLYGSPNPLPDEGIHKFQVYCLDRDDGSVIWVRTVLEAEPDTQRHPKGSFAASTPATDGEFLVAFFGSEGLYVLDMDGQLIWSKDFGVLDAGWYVAPDAQFGYAASPALFEGKVIVQCDVQGESSLCALNLEDGSEVWKTLRDEVPTWSTPTIDVEGGRAQVIANGFKHMGGYDLETGLELWKLSGGGDVPVPTPIVHDDVIYITNGHGRWNPIYAIKASAQGEIQNGFDANSEPNVLWSQRQKGTYMQTPILYRGFLFACNDAGVVTCIDPKTGEHRKRQRLGSGGDGFTASPVAADGKLYFTSEGGDIYVVRADEDMETLAINPMGEICMATPAIVEGELIVRTQGQVVVLREGVMGEAVAKDEAASSDPGDEEVSADSGPKFDGVEVVWSDGDRLPDPKDLMNRHLEARGGREALAARHDVTLSGYWEMPAIGLKGDFKIYHKHPGKMLNESNIPGMGKTLQGVDGQKAWIKNPAVGNTLLDGAIAQEMRRQALWVPELSIEDVYEGFETVGGCRFEGQEAYCVEAKKGTESTYYFFSRETSFLIGRYGRQETLGGPMSAVDIIGGYQEFDGVLVATSTESRFPEQDIQQVSHIQEVSFEPLEETLFEVPSDIASGG